MLRALQSKTQYVSPVWRKASTAAPRSRVPVPKSHKKPSLAAVWSAKPATKPIMAPQKIKISRRQYSSQMPFRDMNKSDLEVIMAGKPGSYYIIDVREPDELQHGTIPHSHNVPLGLLPEAFAKTSEEFEAHHGFSKPSQHDKVILCCKSGVRSGSAAKYLAQLGYRDVYNYPGYMDWFGRGY